MKITNLLLAISAVLNVALLAALLATIITQANTQPAALPVVQAASSEPALPTETAQAENTELDAWIANMRALSQEHMVNAYFLQRLFPDEIVYHFRDQVVYAEIDESLPQHTYSWDNLTFAENGFASYTAANQPAAQLGIDVSRYQGTINWQEVKAAGICFAMLRVGYRGYTNGEIFADDCFEAYITQATAAGIPVGIYFYSQATTAAEALEEAEFVLSQISQYNIAYPVVFDMEEVEAQEYRNQQLTPTEVTDITLAFCARIESAGYHPMVYGNVSWFLART